ncbi:hypothetical protein CRUP_038052 [Coryphaenoides rupestris]|nr:hypothetical protein CRUP_038052 [Coryphaenoides rupestris]
MGELGEAGIWSRSRHTLTKAMNLGEKRLSSELLSWGGFPFTTWVSWSNTLFHLGSISSCFCSFSSTVDRILWRNKTQKIRGPGQDQ